MLPQVVLRQVKPATQTDQSGHGTPAAYRRGVDLPLSLLLQQQHALPPNPASRVHQLSQLPGLRPAPLRGQGLEFEDLREYSVGDDIRFIDWNVTARTQRLHTRLYREERERTVTLALDLRPTMFTGSGRLRAEAAARLGIAMLWQAMQGGDRVACILLDVDGIHTTRPRHGTPGTLAACNLIAERYEHALAHADAPDPDLRELLLRISQSSRQQGLVLLLSGLDGVTRPATSASASSPQTAADPAADATVDTTADTAPDAQIAEYRKGTTTSLRDALAVIGHRRHCTIIWTLDPFEVSAEVNAEPGAEKSIEQTSGEATTSLPPSLPAGFYRIRTAAEDASVSHRAANPMPAQTVKRDTAMTLTTETAERMRDDLQSQLQSVRELLQHTACPYLELSTDTEAATLYATLQRAGLL